MLEAFHGRHFSPFMAGQEEVKEKTETQQAVLRSLLRRRSLFDQFYFYILCYKLTIGCSHITFPSEVTPRSETI